MLLTTLGVAPAQAAVAQAMAVLRSLAPARAAEVVAPAAAAQSGPQTSAWPDPEKPPEQKLTPVTAPELQVAPMSAAEIKDLLSGEALPSSSVASEKGLLTIVALSPAIPGETIEIAWMIEQEKGFEGAMLLVSVPASFTWVGEGGDFDAKAQTLSLKIADTAGLLTFAIAEDALGPFEIKASLQVDGKELAAASLELQDEGLTLLSASGGEALGMDGRVRVSFPKGASDEALAVRVRPPSRKAMPPSSLSDMPFEIVARGQDRQAEVKRFAQPLTIEVRYDEAAISGDESLLHVYYYDVDLQEWMPLPTYVDSKDNILRATSDHLTVFDITTSDWEESRLPSLQAFQVSQFTGAASYSMPLWAPPGPGGLAPELTLSYNSQASDNVIPQQTQASWVGMGWSLDTGYIERNMNGTDDDTGDDTLASRRRGSTAC